MNWHRVTAPFRRTRSARQLGTTLALAVGAAFLCWAFVAHTSLGARLEQRSLDWRFQNRAALPEPADVLIVAIDERSRTFGNLAAASRMTLATTIQQLSAAGVRTIVIDQRLADPPMNPVEDTTFAKELRAGAPVVVAAYRRGDRAGGTLADPMPGVAKSLRRALIADGSITPGVSLRVADSDGVVRRYPAQERGRVRSVAEAALKASGARVPAVPDNALLNWYGPRGSFDTVSYSDVGLKLATMRDMRGRVAFIGVTNGLNPDTHRTPTSNKMPSVEIQATAYANLRDNTWMRQPSPWLGVLLVLLAAVIAWWSLTLLPAPLGLPLAGAMIPLWWVLADRSFSRGLALPVAAPTAAAVAAIAAVGSMLVVAAVRERLRIKGLFARYVSPDVVKELIEGGGDEVEMGGRSQEVTVLFSDIRGFTSLSEDLDPGELVDQLNEYFAEMVAAVMSRRGTLDKFIGDGLMAIFGAPGDQPDHAARACDAALEMLERLEIVNADRADRGLAALRIGIGIHTGVAVVGNIGSPLFRVDFTAMGDAVNLASRLESETKELGVQVLASDETMRQAGGGYEFLERGAVIVKGRTTATRLYQLLTPGEAAAAAPRRVAEL